MYRELKKVGRKRSWSI